jgi:hypothetical protein
MDGAASLFRLIYAVGLRVRPTASRRSRSCQLAADYLVLGPFMWS